MPRNPNTRYIFDSEDIAVIRAMHRRGKSDLEIAKYLGCKTARITRQLASMNRYASEYVPGRAREVTNPYRDLSMGDIHREREAARRGSQMLLEALHRYGVKYGHIPVSWAA
jgi:hypothetical protein